MNIIAHKGDITVAAGNTLEALQSAYDTGVFGLEFDVRITADNVPIVFHNMELVGTDANGFVEDYTYEQIQKFSILYGDTSYRIPSLQEVLSLYAGKVYLVIHVLSYSQEAVSAISEQLKPYQTVWNHMEIISYESAILRLFHDSCQGIACDYLFRPEGWMSDETILRLMIEKAKLALARGVHLPHDKITEETIQRFAQHHLEIHCNVMNDLSEYERLKQLGITQMMTDNIHLFV